jgi:hypothetical protein
MRAQRIGSSTVPGLYGYILVQSSIKRLLFRVPSILSLRCAFARRDYLLGFLPFLDTITSLPIICEASTASLARTTAFSTVRSLLQHDLRVYFIPQPSLGLSLVQGLVHFVQPSTFIRSVPPLPFSIRTLTCKQAATYEHLDSDVLLHTKPRVISSVFSLPNGRSPLRVSCSSRSLSNTSECSSLRSNAHAVSPPSLCASPKRHVLRRWLQLQRIADARLGCLVAETSDLPELFGPSKPNLSKSLELASNRSPLSTPTPDRNPTSTFRGRPHNRARLPQLLGSSPATPKRYPLTTRPPLSRGPGRSFHQTPQNPRRGPSLPWLSHPSRRSLRASFEPILSHPKTTASGLALYAATVTVRTLRFVESVARLPALRTSFTISRKRLL